MSIEADVEIDPEHALELFGSEAPDAAPGPSVPRPVPSTFVLDATVRPRRFFERADQTLQSPQPAIPLPARSRSFVWLLPSASVAFLLAAWFAVSGDSARRTAIEAADRIRSTITTIATLTASTFQPARSSATGPSSAADRPLPMPSPSPTSNQSGLETRATAPSPAPARSRVEPSSSPTNGLLAGLLTIDSRPVGASVFIDEQLVGTTPMLLSDIAPGTHVVRLQLAAHQDWTSIVQVVPDGRNRVTAALEDTED